MKTYRPILAMILFLALGFLLDYVMDFVLSGSAGIIVPPLPYYWLSLLCQVIFGAAFLLLLYNILRKDMLDRASAITFVVVGGIILLYTPLWISFTEVFPGTMDSIYAKNPDFMMPAFWARSFFLLSGVLVVLSGVYGLLPKSQKKKK